MVWKTFCRIAVTASCLGRRYGWCQGLIVCFLLPGTALCEPPKADASPPVAPSSSPRDFVCTASRLYFTADDGLHGRELWVLDERGECRLAADLIPGPEGADPVTHASSDDLFYIYARNADGGADLWRWSIREERGALLYRSSLKKDVSTPSLHPLADPDQGAFVCLRDPSRAWNLWFIPRGETEPRRITDFPYAEVVSKAFRGRVLPDGTDVFVAEGYVWRSDGTSSGTTRLAESGLGRSGPHWFHPLGARLLLSLSDNEHGMEPWVTDGTAAGTKLLKDIRSGPNTSVLGQGGNLKDRTVFGANDEEHGLEPWITDGTPEGTLFLKDINPGRASSDPHYFFGLANSLFFSADDGLHGAELWVTDGTPEGTHPVIDLEPGLASSTPYHLAAYGEKLVFCATTALHGDAIWQTDGTDAGTRLLVDVVPGSGPGGPDNLLSFQDKLIFTYDEPVHGEELWAWAPRSGEAQIVADINFPRFNPSTSPHSLTTAGDNVFFVAPDLEHGEEIWVSDGQEAGTRFLHDIAPGQADSRPEELTAGDANVYFSAESPGHGRELWVSNGTVEGTRLLMDVREGSSGSDPQHLLWASGKLFFTADDGVHGREIWQSDGTESGTHLVGDFAPGAGDSLVARIVPFFGQPYVYLKHLSGGYSLYKLVPANKALTRIADLYRGFPDRDLEDLVAGSVPGEQLVPWVYPCADIGEADPLPVENTLFFVAHTYSYGSELWRTDGTAAGTRLVCDAFPGRAGSSPKSLTWFKGRLYFIGDHPNYGQVLWSTDGTALGMEVVRPAGGDMLLGPVPAMELAACQQGLVMIARAPAVARDLNAIPALYCLDSDDTTEKFWRARSFPEGAEGFRLRHLSSTGLRVFFTADDGKHGEELWTIDEKGEAVMVKDILVPVNLLPLRK